MKQIKIYLTILCIAIVLNYGCTCEPALYVRKFEGLDGQVFSDSVGHYLVALNLDPLYSESQEKRKKSGCLGYYETKGFYYSDTMDRDSLTVICNEEVAGIKSGENWYRHPSVITSVNNNSSLPVSSIRLICATNSAVFKALPDSLHFTINSYSSSGEPFTRKISGAVRQ